MNERITTRRQPKTPPDNGTVLGDTGAPHADHLPASQPPGVGIDRRSRIRIVVIGGDDTTLASWPVEWFVG
jgi:hypothetical protein